jgi:cytochrome c
MRRLSAIFLGCVSALALSLLLARVHPFGDAGLYGAKNARMPLLADSSVPEGVRVILTNKCADCHSYQTRAPFYGRAAPISWLLERDIIHGRKSMSLSAWNSYASDQQEILKAKIVGETKTHEMPPLQYQMIHWNSRINDGDIRTLAAWAAPTAVQAASIGEATVPGDPDRGLQVFEKRCTGCHSLTQNREGPRLGGVFGRTSGTVTGFEYSPALKAAHIVWDDDSLKRWLADPDTLVPDNNMDFHVAKQQERLDIISFLKRSSNSKMN